MPSGKASYNAPPTFAEVVAKGGPVVQKDFPDSLRSSLIEFYTKAKGGGCLVSTSTAWTSQAEQFADEVMDGARFAFGYKEHLSLGLSFEGIVAERKAFLTKLQAAINKIEKYPNCSRTLDDLRRLSVNLRRISPDLDRHLGSLADPRECAAALDSFIAGKIDGKSCTAEIKTLLNCINSKTAKLGVASVERKPKNSAHLAAVELAAWVCPVLERYRMTVTAYVSEKGIASDAVTVLALIGWTKFPVKEEKGSAITLKPFLSLSNRAWRDAIIEARDTAQKVG